MTMRHDATRLRIETDDPRRPRAVVARQGQVLLDTDLDKQAAALLDRIEIETADILDSAGSLVFPAGTTGFQISADGPPANFNIGAGHGYLDGWLLENPAVCKLGTQPHPRLGDTANSLTIIAIKALVRHIDPVEDPALADVALGDAQASGRALNDWQVFTLPIAGGGGIDCASAPGKAEWAALAAPSAGTMSVIRQAAAPSTDPCSLSPDGGYSRLENLLYRIEVHGGAAKAGFPQADGPRLQLNNLRVKLSRRNASLMARVTAVTGAEIVVEPAALDARAWFAPGAYAEIVSLHDDVDPRAALANERLFRVSLATDERIVLDGTAAAIAATGVADDGRWFLRLWDAFPDGSGVATIIAAGGQSQVIDIGDGLSIRFHNGAAATFRRGDYWTFAARADGSVAWPETAPAVPAQMTPHGPETRYAVLATTAGGGSPVYQNCSVPFSSLTDRLLFYRGGDGQSVFAGTAAPAFVPLPQRLRLAVMRGQTPVAGATIFWSPPTGAAESRIDGAVCSAVNSPASTTDADGLVEVEWAIDSGQKLALHQVEARLALTPSANLANTVQFAASFDTAERTSYEPGACSHLVNVDNVQDALDTLCSKIGDEKHEAIGLKSIFLLPAAGSPIPLIKKNLILNALDVAFDSFVKGIAFGFDSAKPDIRIRKFDPVAEIELDLPYPCTDPDKLYWATASMAPATGQAAVTGPFAFQRLRLDGTVQVAGKQGQFDPGLLWTPSEQAQRFLMSAPSHLWGQKVNPAASAELKRAGWLGEPRFERILCRIRLRSAMIFARDKKTGERLYLNAEHLGTTEDVTRRELLLEERDPQRAGDLDMFIYLGKGRGR